MCIRRTSAGRSREPLLDITGIAALRGIRLDGRGWPIGATTTWTDVIRADLPPLFDALKPAAREVGGVQIQNAGTVAGNLCNASPAADGTPVLLALGAAVVLHGAAGERELPLADFVLGSRRTACAADELVVAMRVPARSPRARSAFLKLGGRRYLTISIRSSPSCSTSTRAARSPRRASPSAAARPRARRLRALEARLVGLHAGGGLRAVRRAGRPRAADADRRPARQRRLSPRCDADAAAPRPRARRIAPP